MWILVSTWLFFTKLRRKLIEMHISWPRHLVERKESRHINPMRHDMKYERSLQRSKHLCPWKIHSQSVTVLPVTNPQSLVLKYAT